MQKLSFELFYLQSTRFVASVGCRCCNRRRSYQAAARDLAIWWRGGRGFFVVVVVFLCIKLLGWGLLVGRAGGFPLSQVVAALVLLPHAVDEQEDEEDGEQEANHAARDNS